MRMTKKYVPLLIATAPMALLRPVGGALPTQHLSESVKCLNSVQIRKKYSRPRTTSGSRTLCSCPNASMWKSGHLASRSCQQLSQTRLSSPGRSTQAFSGHNRLHDLHLNFFFHSESISFRKSAHKNRLGLDETDIVFFARGQINFVFPQLFESMK